MELKEVTSEKTKKQSHSRPATASFRSIFRFATTCEKFGFCIGVLASICLGAAYPLSILVFRLIVNKFIANVAFDVQPIYRTSIWFVVIAIGAFIFAFIQTFIVSSLARRQVNRIRRLFLKATFHQDLTWFGDQSVPDILSRLATDIDNIELGIGSKCGEFVQNLSSFFFGIALAFYCNWLLALIALSMLPLIVVGFGAFGGIAHFFARRQREAYSDANAVADEALTSIRTVQAYGGESAESRRYSRHLTEAAKVGIKQSAFFGAAGGTISFSVYSAAALVFWYGVGMVSDGRADPGAVILVFLNVIIGSLFLGSALPNFRYFVSARISAAYVFSIIDRQPPIDKKRPGVQLSTPINSISFQSVNFAYPSRPDKTVLRDFNVSANLGQSIAFVGPSGSGKSTIANLLLRFFDPVEGTITINDTDLRSIDLNWYYTHVGVVQQDPVLFTGTIRENIKAGAWESSDKQMIDAATAADAHHFIDALPQGYDTVISTSGGSLSVGQKQRISIARIMLRNPQVLILDEATSALDPASQRSIQDALLRYRPDRILFTISHRLAPVRHADQILVLNNYSVCQAGSHDELIQQPGLYSAMFKVQDKTTEILSQSVKSTDDAGEPLSTELSDEKCALLDRTTSELRNLKQADCKVLIQDKSSSSRRKVSPLRRIMQLNRPEAFYIVLGCLTAAVAGIIQPAFAILYSEIYAVFELAQTGDPNQLKSRANWITGLMALFGFIRLLNSIIQGYLFGVAGQRLTRRLRRTLFQALLRQDIAWFNEPANQVGVLTNQLSSETNQVQSMCGVAFGRLVESGFLILFSLAIGFFYNWKLTLIVVAFFPAIVLSSLLQIRQLGSTSQDNDKNEAVRTVHEGLTAISTVTSLQLEDRFCAKYEQAANYEEKSNSRRAYGFALVYAISQSMPLASYAAAFSYGAHLIESKEIDLLGMFRVFAAISFAAQAMGRSSSLGLDIGRASRAARSILAIINRSQSVDKDAGVKPLINLASARIHFHNVSFAYPSRPAAPVLKNFSYTFEPTQEVALVGQSGCGKSTINNLLLRFYGPAPGVSVDSTQLDKIAPSWLRQHISLIDQEPLLFNMSLRENIAYGDLTRDFSLQEIIDVAKLACIHDFIMTLPQGYDTLAGPRGCNMSGGERQRVAIARALIRKPDLYLFDEATSALDAQTEAEVETNLRKARQRATRLSITHKFSATQHVDEIIVLENGIIVESGSSSSLLTADGPYAAMYGLESL